MAYNSLMNLIEYKKANLKYEILDEFEAGLELHGYEVKSLRNKQGSLDGSHITVRGNEAFIVGSFIPPYQVANTPESYDPYRLRRLLLNKKEIAELANKEKEKGLTLVPISLYNKGRVIKARIAVVRGKKRHDKRETIKKRDTERDLKRSFKIR